MRIGSTFYYVLKDHLDSANVVTDSSGTIVGEDRFYPFGETRFTTGTMFTDKLFTGQRSYTSDFGLYYYGSRWYDPALGRFIQPDSIVPNPANPQDLNRFSYVRNNPLRYIDPTGHRACDDFDAAGGCYTAPGGGGMGFGGLPPKPKPKPRPDPDPAHLPNPLIPSTGGGESGGLFSPAKPDSGGQEEPPGHYYTTTNVICPAEFNCTQEEIQEYATRFQYPGQNYLFPISDGSIRFVAPGLQLGLIIWDPALILSGAIRVSVSEDGLTLFNRTLPTHIFHDGFVERKYIQDEAGTWSVTTTGYGTNDTPIIGPYIDQANNVVGVSVFNAVDSQMLQYITLDQQAPWVLP